MTADDFASRIRDGEDKLHLHNIVLRTEMGEVTGKGTMNITPDTIHVDIAIDDPAKLPPAKTGVFTKRDSWQMSGVIDHDLDFKCENVGPAQRRSVFFAKEITRIECSISSVDLIPYGLDALSRAGRQRFIAGRLAEAGQGQPSGQAKEKAANDEEDFCFTAPLRKYEAPWALWAPKLTGSTNYFDFSLTKNKCDEDLRVRLSSKAGVKTSGAEDDWAKFHAFMYGLALVTGMNAWPYRIEYEVGGRKVVDKVIHARKLASTSHAPFPEALVSDGMRASPAWNPSDVIQKAVMFFETESALSSEVSELLYLFRQADAGVYTEITTMAICTFLENLIRLLFCELKLAEAHTVAGVEHFTQAKAELIRHIHSKIEEGQKGYDRLRNVVSSAQDYSVERMFACVVQHFNLKWEGDMENIFRLWKIVRNPAVHGRSRSKKSEDNLKDEMLHESQIAGAFNILVLKACGYSGPMRVSCFEDRYRNI